MNYGLYLSASGVLTNMYRQDVFSNNLANVETAGFKRDLPSIRQRDPESIEGRFGSEVNKRLLDKLGGGVLAGRQRIDFSPNPIQKTGGPLDVALDSPDTFFVVSDGNATGNVNAIRLTRDGRFSRNSDGFLALVTGGHRVLDRQNQPIQLADSAPVRIDGAGRIVQNGQEVARLQVTSVSDKDRLVKQGQNLFRFDGQDDLRVPTQQASVRPGFIEASGVDPITALMQLIASTKAVTANGNLIRYHDTLMDRAVNVLGRVA